MATFVRRFRSVGGSAASRVCLLGSRRLHVPLGVLPLAGSVTFTAWSTCFTNSLKCRPCLTSGTTNNTLIWTYATQLFDTGPTAVLLTNGTSVPSGATITANSLNSTCGNATSPCNSTWTVSAEAV